jgi:hypothetical protein
MDYGKKGYFPPFKSPFTKYSITFLQIEKRSFAP